MRTHRHKNIEFQSRRIGRNVNYMTKKEHPWHNKRSVGTTFLSFNIHFYQVPDSFHYLTLLKDDVCIMNYSIIEVPRLSNIYIKHMDTIYTVLCIGPCYTQSRAPGCMTSCAASDGGG